MAFAKRHPKLKEIVKPVRGCLEVVISSKAGFYETHYFDLKERDFNSQALFQAYWDAMEDSSVKMVGFYSDLEGF